MLEQNLSSTSVSLQRTICLSARYYSTLSLSLSLSLSAEASRSVSQSVCLSLLSIFLSPSTRRLPPSDVVSLSRGVWLTVCTEHSVPGGPDGAFLFKVADDKWSWENEGCQNTHTRTPARHIKEECNAGKSRRHKGSGQSLRLRWCTLSVHVNVHARACVCMPD